MSISRQKTGLTNPHIYTLQQQQKRTTDYWRDDQCKWFVVAEEVMRYDEQHNISQIIPCLRTRERVAQTIFRRREDEVCKTGCWWQNEGSERQLRDIW